LVQHKDATLWRRRRASQHGGWRSDAVQRRPMRSDADARGHGIDRTRATL
jgi:hypothetical protein